MIDGSVEVMAIDRRDTRSVRHVTYADHVFTLYQAVCFLAQACGAREPEKLSGGSAG